MKKALTKPLTNLLAVSMMFGSMMSVTTDGKITETPYERPHGFEHRIRTEEEKERKKAHKKKLKARRNAKKGIHENKIKYKRNRKYDLR